MNETEKAIEHFRYGDWDEDGNIHLVRWENISCGFEPLSDSKDNCQHCGGGLNPNECEVIGNVHDNRLEGFK